MPDVTVSIAAEDDVTPALNKIKGEIDGLTQSTAALVEEGRLLHEGFERAGITIANAMRLASQEQKAAMQAYISVGGGGGGGGGLGGGLYSSQAEKDQSALRMYGMELENFAAKTLKAEQTSKALAASQLEAAKAAQVMAMFEQRNAEIMEYVAEREGRSGMAIEETTHKTRGMVAEFGALAEQFVKWGLIWKVFEAAINAVGDAISQVATEAKIAQQAQNSFGLSVNESLGYLENYYQAAHRAGMTWDEWQKFAPGTIQALEQTGMSADDAVSEVSNLGKELDLTGVDLRKLAPAVELGAASFAQLAEAGRMMGPAWAAAEAEFVKVEATEKDYQQALAQDHQRVRQAIQDAHELANARRGIAESTGVAKGAFEAFKKHEAEPFGPKPPVAVQMTPAQWAGVTPEMAKALGRLALEQQKELLQGEEQLAKELRVSLKDVQKAVGAGVPGFDEKALSGAQKRAEHEADTSSEREFQQKNAERTNELEQARLYYNRDVASKLHEQNTLINAQPDALKLAKMAEEDLMHQVEKTTAAIEKQNKDLSLSFAMSGMEPTYGFPSGAAPGVRGFPTPSGQVGGTGAVPVTIKPDGGKIATWDEALTAAVRDLLTMLQGS